MEPNKCEGWHWVSWDKIQEWGQHHDDMASEWVNKRLFLPLRNLVKDYPQLDLSIST